MKCLYCHAFLKPSLLKPKNKLVCDLCEFAEKENYDILDEELTIEKDLLLNPNGRVRPCIDEDDSHGL